MGDSIHPRKISTGSNCYMLHIQGMRLDARKLIWRAFTDENPEYSECHYNVHIISKTREDVLAFSNLELYIESSIFDKWTKEEVNWPWTRSKQGNVPKALKTKKQRVASNRAQRKVQAEMTEKKRTPKVIEKVEVPQPTPNKAVKKTKEVKKAAATQRKHVKLMSEKKFQALRFKKRMNITISKKELEIYHEQRVLRDLKKFLG